MGYKPPRTTLFVSLLSTIVLGIGGGYLIWLGHHNFTAKVFISKNRGDTLIATGSYAEVLGILFIVIGIFVILISAWVWLQYFKGKNSN